MPSSSLSKTAIAAALSVGTATWLSFGVLTVGNDGVRIGVLPSVWVLAALVLLVLAAAVLSQPSPSTYAPSFLSLLILLPWSPFRVPALFLVWTGPAIAFVWSAIAVGTGLRVSRQTPAPVIALLRDRSLAPAIAAALAFMVFLAVRLNAVGLPGGDEPHYLVVAQSLINDGDIRIGNNYSRQDYLAYWGGFLRPHFSSPAINGELYSVHAPGLPVLIAPAFRAAGYWGVVVWLGVVVAVGSAFVWKAGYIVTQDPAAAWFGWSVVALTAPVVLHGTLVYPDPVAGALLAGTTAALVALGADTAAGNAAGREKGKRQIHWPVWRSLSAGMAVGVLPWLHTRLALPALFLGLVFLWRLRSAVHRSVAGWRDVTAFALPALLSLTGWLTFFRTIYGTINPSAPYGDQNPLQVSHIATGLLSLIADQEFGILPNAPVFLLGLSALWSLFKLDRRLTLELLLITGPYVIASSGYPVWFGGNSPPARFLVPVVFPLGIAFATLWAKQEGRSRAMSLTLLGLSVVVAGALAFGGEGGLAYNPGLGRARWLDWIAPLVDLPRALPSFFRAGGTLTPPVSALAVHLILPTVLWGLAIITGWALFRVAGRIPDAWNIKGLSASCCVLTGLALGVSAGWGVAGDARLTPTRSQLRLLRAGDQRWRPLGVQLPSTNIFPASSARTHLALITSPFDPAPPGSLLFLPNVPAGDYRLRVTRQPSGRGDLFLGIGRATGVAWRWSIVGAQVDTTPFRLPLPASSIVVNGDEEAMRSVERVALTPTPQSQQPNTTELRARDAARYGHVVVFATDDRVLLDLRGFWVLGRRRPEVIFTTDNPINEVEMELRNVAIPNRVRLQAGRWSTERALAPDEVWRVRVPVLGLGSSYAVRFEIEDGVPSSSGLLGCRVEVH